MKASGHTAVMAEHAPAEVEADDARTALHRRLEYFPTPPWAARAGGELIHAIDPCPHGQWWAWEPCVGEGHMAYGLEDYFEKVYGTDIHDHGSNWQYGPPLDFLHPEADRVDQIDWIITNPPFAKAAEFVEAGLRRAKRGVAILARTALLESAGRYPLFFPGAPIVARGAPDPTARAPGTVCPSQLYAIAPFFERVPMQLGRWDPKGSTATAYAWFIWMQPAAAADMSHRTRRLLSLRPEVWPIAPGTRDRLTRPEDARLFGVRATGPDLFNENPREGA